MCNCYLLLMFSGKNTLPTSYCCLYLFSFFLFSRTFLLLLFHFNRLCKRKKKRQTERKREKEKDRPFSHFMTKRIVKLNKYRSKTIMYYSAAEYIFFMRMRKMKEQKGLRLFFFGKFISNIK